MLLLFEVALRLSYSCDIQSILGMGTPKVLLMSLKANLMAKMYP